MRPKMLFSDSSQDVLQTVLSSATTTPALLRKCTDCAAMPAASKAISQLVTEKIWRFGIASRPRYVSAVNAAPATIPRTPPISAADTVVPEANIPYRKSTTSEPSRKTARPTTTASAVSGLAPSLTAVPTRRISSAISRPCRAIQALCHMSMITATPSTLALNNSWPEPWNASEMTPANIATMLAPTTPQTTPIVTHRPRSATLRVAARTMPTIKPASMTSRKTMISAPNMFYSAMTTPLAVASLNSPKKG